jgi:hypothetical protein
MEELEWWMVGVIEWCGTKPRESARKLSPGLIPVTRRGG